MLPLESVPNFSEGRDRRTIDAIGAALSTHARLLDVHADEDHNRSVFTLVGEAEQLSDALSAAVRVALERIDLRTHEGAHPRVGATDVVPIVPIEPADLPRAEQAAQAIAAPPRRRVWVAGVSLRAAGARACLLRRGGRRGSRRVWTQESCRPTMARRSCTQTAGAVLVGARRPLIAFNVNLRGDLAAARDIARSCASATAAFQACAHSASTCRAPGSCRSR